MKLRRLALAAVVLLSVFLRFFRIGAGSIWIDEGDTVTLVHMSFSRFVDTLLHYEANMSLYYGLMRLWSGMGDTEAVLRSFSALCGVAAVLVLYDLGRRLNGLRTGLLAATLLAINMFHIWFSQEARSYALVVLLLALSLRLFVEAVEAPRKTWAWGLYVVASVLSVYAHFFAALVVAGEWVALGPRRLKEIGWPRVGLVLAGLALPLLPLGAFVLLRDQGQVNWIPALSPWDVPLTLFALGGFNPLMFLVLLVGIALALLRFRRDDEAAWGMRLAGACILVPIGVVAAASVVKHLFFFRYFAVCLPPTILLGAMTLSPLGPLTRVKRVMLNVAVALVLLMGISGAGFYFKGMFNWGGDWRSATEYVLKNRQAGDAVIFYVTAGRDSYDYYKDRVPSHALLTPMPEVIFPRPQDLASVHWIPTEEGLREAAQGHPRIWLVLHQKDPESLPAPFVKGLHLLEKKDFGPPSHQTPMGVTVGLYEVEAAS